MHLADLLLAARSRALWTDPERTVRTLESFSRTEADGARDIGSAAAKVADPELRGHLQRHAQDELRHAELFRQRARELRERHGLSAGADELDEKIYDLSRGRSAAEVNAHGFFTAGLFDELGEVPYVGMLHAAERRAARFFRVHHGLTAHDADTQRIFAEILRDEQYHVAYTRSILERWTEEGRGREVAAAQAAARSGGLWGAWKRLGVRSGAGFGHVLLRVLYFTALLPFGLLSRRRAPATGWRGAPDAPADAHAFRRQA